MGGGKHTNPKKSVVFQQAKGAEPETIHPIPADGNFVVNSGTATELLTHSWR